MFQVNSRVVGLYCLVMLWWTFDHFTVTRLCNCQ